jgi:ABC-type transport system involved in multi-copper enzyme maturation permease subunit
MNMRLVNAEILRLRRNRPLMIWLAVMTSGAVLAYFLIAQGFHWNNAAQNGPAGGADNLRRPVEILSLIGGVAAAILGTSVATSDLGSGVFRDLVVTGKPRFALFSARVPGMLVIWLGLIGLAYAISVIFDFAFAGGLPTPDASTIIQAGLWDLLVTGIALVAAMGVAAVIGSRGIAIGVLLGWQLAATPLLLNINLLGRTREALLTAATTRVEPSLFAGRGGGPAGNAATALHMSLIAAIAVLAAWVVVPFAAGAWRTLTRDV